MITAELKARHVNKARIRLLSRGVPFAAKLRASIQQVIQHANPQVTAPYNPSVFIFSL